MRIAVIFILIIVSLFTVTGCTTTQKGATIGAIGGAGAGAAIGYWGYNERGQDAAVGAAIGAVTGAATGAIIGYFMGE